MAATKQPTAESDLPESPEPAAPADDSASVIAEARALLTESQTQDPEAYRDPLEVIRSDHVRQLRMCNLFDAFTDKLEVEPVKALAGALLDYLKSDLPLHTDDEEHDLRPALERRCEPEDGLDDVLRQLTREHELNRDLVSFIVDDLESLASGITLNNPVRLVMNVREFSEKQRQHVTWEERVLLPLARQRLKPEDLEEVGRKMAERRGVAFPD